MVLSARNSAFSAPRICTVLAGCFASCNKLPAWLIKRAPTRSPTSAVRFGAIAVIRLRRYSESCVRYAEMEMTWSQSELMCAISESEISVPIEISAAALSTASRSSGRSAAKEVVAAFVRKPICRMTFAYAILSVMILAISGKCQPYHSYVKVNNLATLRWAFYYLDSHGINVDFLVKIVQKSDRLDHHGNNLVW